MVPKEFALWLAKGDLNTKCFHRYIDLQRLANSIWELEGSGG